MECAKRRATLFNKHIGCICVFVFPCQVLRSNLRSLKLTVQQLLTDVSTLLQHTASARQQQAQQQHQQLQQQQQQPTAPWSKQPGLQQQLLRAGLTTVSSHRGVHGGRRCASADGGVPSSAAVSGGEGGSSMVAITMQRLIASIEKMSRHFADCQAGQLIGDYSSSSMGQQAGSGSSSSGTATRGHNSTASTATAAAAAAGTVDGATGGQLIPRPPSSSSSRPGITSKVPGPPVLRGVAAAAAAISTAMANAAGQSSRQTLSNQQQQQEQQEHSHSTAEPHAALPAVIHASADDAMRHSFDSTQARAAADAWFASKARASDSLLASADTADMHSRHAAGPADASSASLSSSRHSSDVGSTSRHHSSATCRPDAPCQQQQQGATSSSHGTAHNPQHVQLEQQQQQQVPKEPRSEPEATAPEHGRLAQSGNGSLASSGARQQASQASAVVACQQLQKPSNSPAGAAATAAAQAASAQTASQGRVVGQPSSSSRSLGCSLSEVWQAPHSRSTGRAAHGRAVTSDPGLVTPWNVRQQRQQGPHTSLSQLQNGQATKHPDKPSPPPTSSRPSGVWGSGASVRQAASRRRPLTAAGGLLPSGPLTAALNSSTAHRQAHSRASNTHSPQQRREQQVIGGRGPTADDCSSWAASSSRSASSCSQRSAHSSSGRSSNSCVSTAPQPWQHGPAGGHVGAHSANSRGMRAALVSASSNSSLGSDAVLLGSFTTAASGSANNSPASKSVTSVLSSPVATHDIAPSSSRARLTQQEASSIPRSVMTATGYPDAHRAGQSHQQQQQAYNAAVSAGAGPPKAARALQWSDDPSNRQTGAAAEPTPPAAGSTAGHVSSSTAEQLMPAGLKPPAAAATADAAPKGESSEVTGQQPASIEPAQAASESSRQQETAADAVPDSAVPGPVTELQSSLKVQPRQQLQLQPVLSCLLGGRVRIGLLSPILEEGIGSNGSTNTTPGMTAGSPAVAAPLRGAFSNGSCRSSSKLRSSSSEVPSAEAVGAAAAQENVPASAKAGPAVQPQSGYAAAQEMPDAFKQGSRESSPKTSRVESPPDTTVGRDTAPCGPGGFTQQRRKQTGIHDQQEPKALQNGSVEHPDTYMAQGLQDKQQQQCLSTHLQQLADNGLEHSAARAMSRSSLTFSAALDAAAAAGSRWPRSAHMCRRSWDGSGSSSERPLVAFPVDLGPLSHSIESLDTLLMDTSCCFSEEEVCIDSLGSSSSRQELQLPADNAAAEIAGAEGAAAAGCMLDLQDLLAIVLDVINDKQAADKRCARQLPGQFLNFN